MFFQTISSWLIVYFHPWHFTCFLHFCSSFLPFFLTFASLFASSSQVAPFAPPTPSSLLPYSLHI